MSYFESGRICGAGGGGGCMTMFREPGAQRAVISALEDLGAQHIPYAIDIEGLKVQVREKFTRTVRAPARASIRNLPWVPIR